MSVAIVEAPIACRVCGCTDDRACTWFEARGDGSTIGPLRCSWVEPGLCSECIPRCGDDDAAEPLLYDAFGRPLRVPPA